MKYFLFDFFVATSVAMLVAGLIRSMCSGQYDVSTPDFTNGTGSIVINQQQDCELPHSNNGNEAPSKPEDPRRMTSSPDSSTQHGDQENQYHFKVGDMVELYGKKSSSAMPVIVSGYTKRDGTSTIIKYDLINAFVRTKPFQVASEFVHPYQVYEDGTVSSCDVPSCIIDGVERTRKILCKITSHVIKKNGEFGSYQVEYLEQEHSKGAPEYLPILRVQRRLDR